MKTVSITADDGMVDRLPVKYSESFSNIAERLVQDAESEDFSTVERAGLLSLASLLDRYASGTMPEKESHSLLRNLATIKTPAPVQKIEQHSLQDIRLVFTDIVQSNASAMEIATQKALENRQLVQSRLGLTGTLQLPEITANEAKEAEQRKVIVFSDRPMDETWRPGIEPLEITLARRATAGDKE